MNKCTASGITDLQVWNGIEKFDDFVSLEHAVSAIANRHQTAVTTLQVQTVDVAINDADVSW